MTDDDEIIAVVQAHKDGKQIQTRPIDRPDREWLTCTRKPFYNFEHSEYRVKPEPREWWVNLYDDGVEKHGYMYDNKEKAGNVRANATEQVHVREVLDEL